ncbi:IclR family transcriptional regulator [Alicyclobacillus dauci]|uniref:Helix-turn-helix domain-containing protein n=1 Tax=Alicyclobacillus dauci TaxID=1475485 RepID=A0ABY6Z5B6_9BACL|nr:helix-turn-helix domain-containing protein [Alicyclobacillus dauci]WAH38056.1 helix-turn-helix domain-containing protein [Alicyclobacillus dauci]
MNEKLCERKAVIEVDNQSAVLVTAQHSLQILKLFTNETPELGICDLSRKMGLAKSTVSRIVSTFVEEAILEKNRETGKYRLSPMILELGLAAQESSPFVKRARDEIDALSKRFNCEAFLAVRDGMESVIVYRAEDSQETLSGECTFLPTTLAGLVTLVFSEDEPEAFVSENWPVWLDPGLLPRMQKIIEGITDNGFACGEEPLRRGKFTLACPVFNTTGTAFAAIAVTSDLGFDHASEEVAVCLGRIAQRLSADAMSNDDLAAVH